MRGQMTTEWNFPQDQITPLEFQMQEMFRVFLLFYFFCPRAEEAIIIELLKSLYVCEYINVNKTKTFNL